MSFKIINGYYPAAERLKERFGFEVDPFCLQEEESIDQVFFSCSVMTSFLQDLVNWMSVRIVGMTPLTLRNLSCFTTF